MNNYERQRDRQVREMLKLSKNGQGAAKQVRKLRTCIMGFAKVHCSECTLLTTSNQCKYTALRGFSRTWKEEE